MPLIIKRKLLQIGDSLGITIPEDVINSYRLKKGDRIYIITDAVDGFIIVDLENRSVEELWKTIKED